MRRDYGGNRAIINAKKIISCVNGNNRKIRRTRNSNEKYLRDTKKIQSGCTSSLMTNKKVVILENEL